MITRFASLITIAAVAATSAACGKADSERAQARNESASVELREQRVADGEPRYADQDRDGRVTRDEAAADPYLQASFDRYDRNNDEALDRGEFARLEADSTDAQSTARAEDGEIHTLRPRREFPRPED